MDLAELKQKAEQERQELQNFLANVEKEVAYRRGRIEMLDQLIKEQEEAQDG